MNSALLSKLLSLIPLIAFGIQTLHADHSLGHKTQMAQDALGLAIAGAKVGLPETDSAAIDGFGSAAQTVLASTVTALHNSNPPAPVAAPVTKS